LAAQPSKKFIFQTLSKAKQGLAKIEKKSFDFMSLIKKEKNGT
jgi:hypothetical protein